MLCPVSLITFPLRRAVSMHSEHRNISGRTSLRLFPVTVAGIKRTP
jgi:hypothetical protein